MTCNPQFNIKIEEEVNICLMKKHKDNKVNYLNSHFTYYKLFLIYKKLDNESRKLKEIIYVFKLTIYSLEK